MYADILIVDDEPDIRDLIAGVLEDEGYDTRVASNAKEALEAMAARQPSLLLLDIWLEGSSMDGLEILAEARKRYPELLVVMISGHGNIETAVQAIKDGAYDYLEKPFKTDRLILAVTRALENNKLKSEVSELKQKRQPESELLGSSASMTALRNTVDKIAGTNSRILIVGTEGSGCDALARAIHEKSPRASGPFVELPVPFHQDQSFLISLFGREGEDGLIERGAWERAHRGTLFLDGVEFLATDVQTALLSALNGRRLTRQGGTSAIESDVRVVSAATHEIERAVSDGRLNPDLYGRLAVVPVALPPLSERLTDLPELVQYFVQEIATSRGVPALPFSVEALAVMQTFDWPGNLVQLRNAIERILIEAKGKTSEITPAELPEMIGGRMPKLPDQAGGHELLAMPLRVAREVFEKEYIAAQIARFDNNISRAAEHIGMERAALHRKIKSLGINLLH